MPPEPIAQSGAKRRAIWLSCCAISQPGFLLTLLTSLTCHDQRGAFRVQRLTRTPGGGGRSITSTFIHLAFFYRFIPPSPLHHLTSSRPLWQKKEEKNSGSSRLNSPGTDWFRTLCAVIGAGATNSSSTCTWHEACYTRCPTPTYVDILKKDVGVENTGELARRMEDRDGWRLRWKAGLRTTYSSN